MVQLLILYFFSIKSTHGYEIQRFISLNQMSEWNNIKSGSIYYAIAKLERDGCIRMLEKEEQGEKKKQTYEITQKGRQMLHELALKEIKKPLQGISSEKFLLYPIVANLSKQELILQIQNHITQLSSELDKIKVWKKEKETQSYYMEIATLDYMESTIRAQMLWHELLLEHLDETIKETEAITNLIRETDFMQYNLT